MSHVDGSRRGWWWHPAVRIPVTVIVLGAVGFAAGTCYALMIAGCWLVFG